MKRFFILSMALILTGMLSNVKAQDVSKLSDKELSNQYKREIDVLKSEIKTLKLKLKSDSENVDLKANLRQKTETFNTVKDKKAVIDKAIKSKKASEKAQDKAEKAQNKAAKAAQDAQKVKNNEN